VSPTSPSNLVSIIYMMNVSHILSGRYVDKKKLEKLLSQLFPGQVCAMKVSATLSSALVGEWLTAHRAAGRRFLPPRNSAETDDRMTLPR